MSRAGPEGLHLVPGGPTAQSALHDAAEAARASTKDEACQGGGPAPTRLVGAAAERVLEAHSVAVRLGAISDCHVQHDPSMLVGLRKTSASVMIHTPQTLPARASVDDVRAQMTDDHVHMVLLTDGDKLRGTLVRTDLPPAESGHEAALSWAVLRDRTVSPDTPTALVQARLNHTEMRRLAVVDADHRLLGLVCLKRSRSGFCSDADVAARIEDAAAAKPEDGESTCTALL